MNSAPPIRVFVDDAVVAQGDVPHRRCASACRRTRELHLPCAQESLFKRMNAEYGCNTCKSRTSGLEGAARKSSETSELGLESSESQRAAENAVARRIPSFLLRAAPCTARPAWGAETEKREKWTCSRFCWSLADARGKSLGQLEGSNVRSSARPNRRAIDIKSPLPRRGQGAVEHVKRSSLTWALRRSGNGQEQLKMPSKKPTQKRDGLCTVVH